MFGFVSETSGRMYTNRPLQGDTKQGDHYSPGK